MFLIWGSTPLRVSRLLSFDSQAVFDPSGCDYLYTTYQVGVECLWGRGAEGYTIAALTPQGPIPRVLAGFLQGIANGVQSVTATRNALSQPRQPFVLYTINPLNGQPDILLSSPGVGPANGPRMIEPPAVQSIHGNGSLVFCRLTFEVDVNDCPIYDAPVVVREIRTAPPGDARPVASPTGAAVGVRNTVRKRKLRPSNRKGGPPVGIDFRGIGGIVTDAAVNAVRRATQFDATELAKARGDLGLGLLSLNGRPVLLSNRWTSTVGYDPSNESPVYNIRGSAIFRRDALQAFRVASPDSFRGSLLPLLIDNAVREINDVTLSADGLTLNYDVTDRVQVRSYIDWRVKRQPGGPAGMVNTSEEPRHVARVSLVSRREYVQPSVGNAVFDLIDTLQGVQFALQDDKVAAAAGAAVGGFGGGAGGPLGAGAGGIGGAVAGFLASPLLKVGIAAARTVSNTLPRTVEAASAEVQITKEGTLADGQALAFALISGCLGYGIRNGNDRAAQVLRFTALPPASSISLECDHINGIVRAAMQIEQSGLVDYIAGGQLTAYGKMFAPLSDEVEGGIPPLSLANLTQFLLTQPGAKILIDKAKQLFPLSVEGLLQVLKAFQTPTIKYQGELLVTDASLKLRGPSQDGISRSAADLLLRSAQMLLRPCAIPQAPANLTAVPFPKERSVELGGKGNVDQAIPKEVRDLLDGARDRIGP